MSTYKICKILFALKIHLFLQRTIEAISKKLSYVLRKIRKLKQTSNY